MIYHLFAGQIYYAKGGINDYVSSSFDYLELKQKFNILQEENKRDWQWYQIVDQHLNLIEESEKKPYN